MLGDVTPLPLLELLSESVFDAPDDPAPEEPLLPPVELSDSSEGELEPACGELLDSPASGFEGAFSAPEEAGVPKCEDPVRKPFALLATPPAKAENTGPGGWSALVGAE